MISRMGMQELELDLKQERESNALSNESLQGQLDKEQELAKLHKRIGEERSKKATELGGIVQQFKEHLQVG